MDKFLGTGMTYIENFKGDDRKLDEYDRYIYMPITNEQGQAMYRKAEMLYMQPPEYNLYANNCNHVAQQILEGGGLNFAPTKGSALDEQINMLTIGWPGGIQRTITNYAKDRLDKTIPNAAYNYAASIADKKGWSVGDTGYKPEGLNPFK